MCHKRCRTTHLCSLNALISRTMMSLSSTPSKTPTWRSSMSRWRWETWDTETSSTNSTRSRSHMSNKQRHMRKEIKNTELQTAERGQRGVQWEREALKRGRIWHEKNRLTAGSIWHSGIWERSQRTKWRISLWLCLVCSPYAAQWPAQRSAVGCWISCCVETICMHGLVWRQK